MRPVSATERAPALDVIGILGLERPAAALLGILRILAGVAGGAVEEDVVGAERLEEGHDAFAQTR